MVPLKEFERSTQLFSFINPRHYWNEEGRWNSCFILPWTSLDGQSPSNNKGAQKRSGEWLRKHRQCLSSMSETKFGK